MRTNNYTVYIKQLQIKQYLKILFTLRSAINGGGGVYVFAIFGSDFQTFLWIFSNEKNVFELLKKFVRI